MKLLRFRAKVHPLDQPEILYLEQEEVSILRTLVQDHINTLSDIAAHYAPADITAYTGQLEELARKLIRLEKS